MPNCAGNGGCKRELRSRPKLLVHAQMPPSSVFYRLSPIFHLLSSISTPRPERNRCSLETRKAETPKKTLYLVPAPGRLPLPVVSLGQWISDCRNGPRNPLLSRQQARSPAGNLSPSSGSFCLWLPQPRSSVFVKRHLLTRGGLLSRVRSGTVMAVSYDQRFSITATGPKLRS
jgi:hypothetical protein